MRIRSSQVRKLADLLPDQKSLLMVIFPEAWQWEKISPEEIIVKAYPFAGDEFAFTIFHKSEKIGIWRPDAPDGYQEFVVGTYMYRVFESTKQGSVSVYRCEE